MIGNDVLPSRIITTKPLKADDVYIYVGLPAFFVCGGIYDFKLRFNFNLWIFSGIFT